MRYICQKYMEISRDLPHRPLEIADWRLGREWTLFLDRDGVINRQIKGDYVRHWDQFEWIPGSQEAIAGLSALFGWVFIATNQQGVGKGLMTGEAVEEIHDRLIQGVERAGGRIDRIYYCPALVQANAPCRKPEIGMALQAQMDFPGVDLRHSIMVGDSETDIGFGRKAGMKTVLITRAAENQFGEDLRVTDLLHFYHLLKAVI